MSSDPLRTAVDAVVARAATADLDDLDDATREALLAVTLDALGIAAAGEVAPSIAPSLAGLLDVAGRGDVPVPWWGASLPPADAAFALSLLIHAWDFDDTHDEAVVHAATVAIPAAYATAHAADADGATFLAGVLAGVEVVVRLSLAVGPQRGVIRSAGLGALGAATAAARVRDLGRGGTAAALSLAAPVAMAPTSRQVVKDGAVVKRHQPGFAVRHGVLATALAHKGVAGAPGWFTGSYGLRALVVDEDAAHAALVREGWEVTRLSLKPYPACRYLHASIAGALELTGARPTTDVARVTVHVPEGMAHELVARPWERRGQPVVDAQFSVPWAVAAAVLRGAVDLECISGPDLLAADIEDLARRVTVVQDRRADATGMTPVTVVLEDAAGTARRAEVTHVPGAPDHPLGTDAIVAKIAGCLRAAGRPAALAEQLRDAVHALPTRRVRGAFGPFTSPSPTDAPHEELVTWTSA